MAVDGTRRLPKLARVIRAAVRLLLVLVFSSALGAADATPATASPVSKGTIVIVHGAWAGAWQSAKIEPLLRAQGYDVRRLTLTGLGERVHLATPEVGLSTHIQDVVNVLLFERLDHVILLGHSYGGMVITGVADRVPERIARLVYLDAFLPDDGESVTAIGAAGIDFAAHVRDGFILPWWQSPTKPVPNDVPMPLKTFTEPIVLKNSARAKVPATYILTVDPGKKPEQDGFWFSAERARQRGWPVVIMEADHVPQWRKPAETAELLTRSLSSP